MQQFDVASVSIVIASMSVVLGVILATLQLREQSKTRQAQLFMEIYAQFSQSELLERRFQLVEAFKDQTQDGHPEIWETSRGDMSSILFFFEGVGVLVKRRLIDVNLVADLMSGPTMWVWEAIENWVMWRREIENRPQLWEWIEYLYHEIQKIPSRLSPY
ncbi:MAG: hypothetical protein JSW05_01860 [Candidatus Thorarchaeota archaeon]|nr:MAG: hypothetical protein JSW05_01860 [Candidatus Thorarchaeota archaeon]